jgi:hypothetical protein
MQFTRPHRYHQVQTLFPSTCSETESESAQLELHPAQRLASAAEFLAAS